MVKSDYMELDIDKVKLDVDNPRIKMYLENYENISADGIALALNTSASDGQSSFSSLKESIKVNGGIINPIIVNHDSNGEYIVIEGNTRLQIYKDFLKNGVEGNWNKIRCIVYEKLCEADIHSIRLQSHLVGPRDWDPYSKAKYLEFLMNKQRLPMASIISFCGGKKNEITKLVDAYIDMQNEYVPLAKEMEFDVDYKDFSKFSELQNHSISESLVLNDFTKKDFAKWVLNGNIDTAQNVRKIPIILKNKLARDEFLKTNITKAMTKVFSPATDFDCNSIDYIELCKALTNKLDLIELKEAKYLASEDGQEKRDYLLTLIDTINYVLDDNEED